MLVGHAYFRLMVNTTAYRPTLYNMY